LIEIILNRNNLLEGNWSSKARNQVMKNLRTFFVETLKKLRIKHTQCFYKKECFITNSTQSWWGWFVLHSPNHISKSSENHWLLLYFTWGQWVQCKANFFHSYQAFKKPLPYLAFPSKSKYNVCQMYMLVFCVSTPIEWVYSTLLKLKLDLLLGIGKQH